VFNQNLKNKNRWKITSRWHKMPKHVATVEYCYITHVILKYVRDFIYIYSNEQTSQYSVSSHSLIKT
jgi:hypothetical protein